MASMPKPNSVRYIILRSVQLVSSLLHDDERQHERFLHGSERGAVGDRGAAASAGKDRRATAHDEPARCARRCVRSAARGLPVASAARLLPTMGHRGTVLQGSAGSRSLSISCCRYGRRTYSGRPSSSIRFSASTAMPISVARRRSVRDRRPSPITRLKRLMSASTRARQV